MTAYLGLVVLWSLVTYRVARFIVLDTMIDGTRARFNEFLARRHHHTERRPMQLLIEKLSDLIHCPYCITVWVAAGVLIAHRVFVASFPVPVWGWLASSAGGLIVWTIVDSEEAEDGSD